MHMHTRMHILLRTRLCIASLEKRLFVLPSRNGMGAGGLVGDTAHIPDDVTAREAAPAGPITSTGSEISRDPPKVTFSSSQDSDGLSGQFPR